MTWRKAHGQAAKCGRLTVLETVPSDELPPASPADPGRPDRDQGGRFLPGNRWSRMAKWRAGPTGVLAGLEAQADATWQAANRWGRRYAAHRTAELARMHGGELSAGVCSIVVSAAQHMADSRWLRAKGAAEGSPELMRMSVQAATSARQAERDAWELASREAQARPQQHEDLHRRLEAAFGGKK